MTLLQQSPLVSGAMPATPPAPRALGAINWVGFATLTKREIRRFLKVWVQTIAAPVVTTLLFYAVFALALGGVVRMVGDVPLLRFLGPGLIMMGMAQNAFANTSSSVLVSKVQGNIVDVLMPPLSPFEFVSAFVTGGVVRGLMVGAVTWMVIQMIVPLGMHAPLFVLFHAVMASMLLSLLGLIGGIWADKFDHMAAVTNFVITPLSFLSGTFYTLDSAPRFFHAVAHVNPFFYFIDGFRYGFIGHTDGTLGTGIAVMLAANLALWLVALRMVATGYKLKA
ncbi:ABC transporter permease [Nitrospirillum iridis]|uniref:Transport permease protein n=1 Tax=Nitrospirillum iridis TaxID=765888 RepID=A0A7X0B0X6_9PROT|nr:ABC transporter permease [Nitrospirillum iridis]MBB6252655.1 ABC-2 type transport system permease protein [Nitrospirillum iridis]